jgi:hypothetical protein
MEDIMSKFPLLTSACVCDESSVECEIECFDLLLKRIIPIFYKSFLSLSDPKEIIVRVRTLRKREGYGNNMNRKKGRDKTIMKKKIKRKRKAKCLEYFCPYSD